MPSYQDDFRDRWLRFLEDLDDRQRSLAFAAAAMVPADLDPGRWGRVLQAARDALEYLETLGGWVRIPKDPAWPSCLDCGDEPVALLVGRGEVPPGRALGIVGTRRSSSEGNALAGRLAVAWVEQGGWVVSGGAIGIDAAAHRGALAVGGRTVVVAGTGLGHTFPPQHRTLFARIARSGAVVSEYPPTFSGRPRSFLDRNRIIAGFADNVVVVEAPPRSGAISTARFALKCERKVLTVPWASGSERSEGARRLLSEGAIPLRGPEDLPASREAQETLFGETSDQSSPVSAVGRRVLEALDSCTDGRHVDDIGRLAALTPGELSAALLELEFEGLVEAMDGGRFRRNRMDV